MQMNNLLEYQLTSIDYRGTLTESQQLALFNLVNETYNKADENRTYQRQMLDVAKEKIRVLHDLSKGENKHQMLQMEKKYERLLSNLQPYYFFYAKNDEGNLTSVSDSVSSMLGFTSEEFISKYTNTLSYGLMCDIETKRLISEYGYNIPYEITLENNKGINFHLEVTEYLVFDQENNVQGIEGIVRNITEHTVTKKRISNMLYSDTLTGISNRLHLETLMEKLIVENYNRKSTFSMLFLDLDHFKHINDTLGHDIGDILLQEVASNISDSIRHEDIFARIGGDEFVIIFKDMQEEQLVITVEKLMKVIHKLRTIHEYELRVTASIGIVMYPQDGKTTVDLMKSADIAMYQSKKRGRNTYTFFQDKHSESLQNELQIMQDMSAAIEHNEFELYYQPKVLVKDNKVIAAEALIRWEHPILGHIPPEKFIPLAENTGFILKLGRWVIKEVCKFIGAFNTLAQNQKMNISINISIRQFQQENIYQVLKENVSKYNIDGSQISLEITESIMMENLDKMREKLNQIKTLGINISLDDFGTGYSTLSYLSKLSIDELKIDKAFVDEIPENGNSSIVLDTIIAMGKTLNMSVVAEGVEHEYQRQYLEDKGCDIYQGYLFAKPMMQKSYMKRYHN